MASSPTGGTRAYIAGTLAALEAIDEVALLCSLPEESGEAIGQCERRRDRVAILSLPAGPGSVASALAARPPEISAFAAVHHSVGVVGRRADAARWPRGRGLGERRGRRVAGRAGDPRTRTIRRWSLRCRASEIEALVAGGVNPLRDLRAFDRGVRLWSARTLDPDLERRSLPVQRLRIFLETSIGRGLAWVAFEVQRRGAVGHACRRQSPRFCSISGVRGGSRGGHPTKRFLSVATSRR